MTDVLIKEYWNKDDGMRSVSFSLDAFKPGDFIVITYDGDGTVSAPGFFESGLKGGLVIRSDQKWEKWTDEDLAKVGLMRIPPGDEEK